MTHTISNIIDLTNAPTPPRWFEFLLEPGKLQQHLETIGCDPSPTQLISLFFRNIPTLAKSNINSQTQNLKNGLNGTTSNGISSPQNSPPGAGASQEAINDLSDKVLVDYSDSLEVHIPPDSYEAKYRAKKAYALQILAIQVASHLKWNLDTICNNLTIPIQYKLIQALNSACLSTKCPPEMKKFADILYWHWFLRSAISYQLSSLQLQSNNTTIIYLSQLQQQQQAADSSALFSMGELFSPNSKQLKSCFNDLNDFIWELTHNKDGAKKAKNNIHPFKKVKLLRPRAACFDYRDEEYNDWTRCELIDSKEIIEAACYDLGKFFFFRENYELAKHSFEQIKDSEGKFPRLLEYLKSATEFINHVPDGSVVVSSNDQKSEPGTSAVWRTNNANRMKAEKYIFDCMAQFSKKQKENPDQVEDEPSIEIDDRDEEDTDLRFELNLNQAYPTDKGPWSNVSPFIRQQQMLETAKGDLFMSQGNYKQAMGCFVGTIMLMTDYFRYFSKNYVEEEPYITRMIQCSISLSCFTQAVALCQMSRNLNYTIAFKQLNERVCNDCCDDIYECIWNITLLEYIINLHAKRGEVERRTKVIQLIGQLELNENNPDDILKEAEHVRRGRFFRIMSNKYL